VPEKQTRNFAW